MARSDLAKRDVQDAAATIARFVAGIVFDHFHAVVIDQPPRKAAAPQIEAVNRQQAADLLNLSVKTVDRLIVQGVLEPLPKTGRAVRIPVNQIEAYLKQQE